MNNANPAAKQRNPRRTARPQDVDTTAATDELGAAPSDEKAAPIDTASIKATTKTQLLLQMLTRPDGASLDQMVTATGWLPHTTRAALTGIKRKGHQLTSEKVEGVRIYRIAPVGDAA